MCSYRAADDLDAIGRLIRRAWALRPGCRLVTVHSWSTSEPAAALYESLGYRAVDRQELWRAPGR